MQLFPASGVNYLRELLDLANRVISVTPRIPHDSHHARAAAVQRTNGDAPGMRLRQNRDRKTKDPHDPE